MKEEKQGFWDGLLDPINPNLCVLIGYLNIFYGSWKLIMGHSENPLAYPLLEHFVSAPALAIFLIVCGLAIVLTQKILNKQYLSKVMSMNGIIWAVMSALVVAGNLHSTIWILMGMVGIYSLFVAANLKTHFSSKSTKRKRE